MSDKHFRDFVPNQAGPSSAAIGVKGLVVKQLVGFEDNVYSLPNFHWLLNTGQFEPIRLDHHPADNAPREHDASDDDAIPPTDLRAKVIGNLQAFCEVALTGDVLPLVVELAVIDDESVRKLRLRRAREDPDSFGERPRFVSHVASYLGNDANPALLRAWNSAIERLTARDSAHKQSIVGDHETYKHGVIVSPLKALSSAEEAQHDLIGIVRDVHAYLQRSFLPSRAASELNPALEPTCYARSYHFTHHPGDVGNSTRALEAAAQLSRYLQDALAAQLERNVCQPSEAQALLDLVGRSAIVIVPFRRPTVLDQRKHLASRDRNSRPASDGTADSPGGCLFFLATSANQAVFHEDDDRIQNLALRLNWTLLRAALRESRVEADLVRRRNHDVAMLMHCLSREQGRLADILTEVNEKASHHLEDEHELRRKVNRAHHLMSKLNGIGEAAVQSWKVRQGIQNAKAPDLESTPAQLHHRIQEFVDEVVPELARAYERNHLEDLELTVTLCSQLSDVPAVLRSEAYLGLTLSEALANLVRHCDSSAEDIAKLHLSCEPESKEVVLELRNKISEFQLEAVRAALAEREHRLGLSQLEMAALAWTFQKPRPYIDASGWFVLPLPIAKVRQTRSRVSTEIPAHSTPL